MSYHVLIVEDEPSLSDYVKKELIFEDYQVSTAFDGLSALEIFETAKPAIDVVLLDWMIPKLDGLTVLRRMKKIQPDTPIIFLTARDYIGDKVAGLDAGADDYITKPFSIDVLVTKINAIIRRVYNYNNSNNIIGYKDLIFDIEKGIIKLNNKNIELTKNEIRILTLLLKNKDKVVSRESLMMSLWDSDEFVTDNALTVNINRLRSKIKELGVEDFIKTKKGIGYIVE